MLFLICLHPAFSIQLSRLRLVNYPESSPSVCWLGRALPVNLQTIKNTRLFLIKWSQALNYTRHARTQHTRARTHGAPPTQELFFIQLSACLCNLKQLRQHRGKNGLWNPASIPVSNNNNNNKKRALAILIILSSIIPPLSASAAFRRMDR